MKTQNLKINLAYDLINKKEGKAGVTTGFYFQSYEECRFYEEAVMDQDGNISFIYYHSEINKLSRKINLIT